MTETWKTTPGLDKLGLRMCVKHGKLFSAKEGARCKKCAESIPQKLCKRGHSRSTETKRCAQCDKDRRETKLDSTRARNADATAARAARRAGLGEGVHS